MFIGKTEKELLKTAEDKQMTRVEFYRHLRKTTHYTIADALDLARELLVAGVKLVETNELPAAQQFTLN